VSRAFCSAGAVVTGVCDLEYSTLSGHCTLEPVHTVRQLAPCLWCAIVHRKRSGGREEQQRPVAVQAEQRERDEASESPVAYSCSAGLHAVYAYAGRQI
jgi:hypothetical protein